MTGISKAFLNEFKSWKLEMLSISTFTQLVF